VWRMGNDRPMRQTRINLLPPNRSVGGRKISGMGHAAPIMNAVQGASRRVHFGGQTAPWGALWPPRRDLCDLFATLGDPL
jgi:hypothetical protein